MSQQPGQNVKPPRTTAIQVPQDVGRKTRKTKVQNLPLEPTVIPTMIKCLKHDTEEQSNLEDFINEIYSIEQTPVIQTFNHEDEGNIQHKLKLIDPTEEKMDKLANQMKYRLAEGLGQAYYRVGVEDCGKTTGLSKEEMMQSLKTLCCVAQKIKADVIILKVSQGLKGKVVELMVRKANIQGAQLEIRALLFGQSLSGKSTLLGVLKSGIMDDGKGKARTYVEASAKSFLEGNTHTANLEVLGFDSNGKISNRASMLENDNILATSTKIMTMIDVGGHKRAEKQLVSSLCSFLPQYALLVFSAMSGKVNPQPLHLASAFNLPLIVVITHIDVATNEQLRNFIYNVKTRLRESCPQKVTTMIKNAQDAVLLSQIVANEAVIPIFPLSNVTGNNLDNFISFLNLLPPVSDLRNNTGLPTEFLISDKFLVNGKLILAGTVIKGNINKGQILQLGPDCKGNFRAVEIIDIKLIRVNVKYAKCGQTCTVHINPLNYCKEWLEKEPNGIRKGMVLVQSKANPRAAYQFQAEIELYPKTTDVTITQKYQPVVNTLTTRQSCKIVIIKKPELQDFPELTIKKQKSRSICGRTNKKEPTVRAADSFRQQTKRSHDFSTEKEHKDEKPMKKPLEKIQQQGFNQKKRKQKEEITIRPDQSQSIRLRFRYYPQYITLGQRIIINDTLLKAIGRITDIYY